MIDFWKAAHTCVLFFLSNKKRLNIKKSDRNHIVASRKYKRRKKNERTKIYTGEMHK